MRKYILPAILIVMVFTFSVAIAGEHDGGRQIWKKTCRIACHDGNTVGSPLLSPDSKTQMQWKNSFADNKNYIMKFHKDGQLPKLSEKEWAAIYDFVYHHAHDSHNPEDCMGNAGALVQ